MGTKLSSMESEEVAAQLHARYGTRCCPGYNKAISHELREAAGTRTLAPQRPVLPQ